MSSSSLGIPSFLVMVLVLLCSSLSLSSPTFSSKVVTSEELNNICSKTSYPALCLSTLKYKATITDLNGLCQYSIENTRDDAVDTYNVVGGLMNSTTDPKIKEHYSFCYINYEDAIHSFDFANDNMKAGAYGAVSTAAKAAMAYIGDCTKKLHEPPFAESSIELRNKFVTDNADIIVVISNMLAQKN